MTETDVTRASVSVSAAGDTAPELEAAALAKGRAFFRDAGLLRVGRYKAVEVHPPASAEHPAGGKAYYADDVIIYRDPEPVPWSLDEVVRFGPDGEITVNPLASPYDIAEWAHTYQPNQSTPDDPAFP